MKLKLGLMVLLTVFCASQVAAQSNSGAQVDTVVIASTANYPDAMISASVSNKLGYPVLLTANDSLSSSTETTLEELDPNSIIMVGGPAVLSEEVESAASSYGNVTRLWGTTQVGTSVEVAEYFWADGSEEAVIVQYPLGTESYHEFMAAVKNDAGERPVLVSKEGTLSASVLTAVQDLGVEEAEVYSTDSVNVTEDLQEAGVSEVDMNEGEREEIEEELRNRTSLEEKDELVIVATSGFRDTISVPNNPNSASYLVSSESQIDGALEKVRKADSETRIKVVGNPSLASTIASRIESETNRSVSQVSGPPEEVSARQAREQGPEWKNIQERRSSRWKQSLRLQMRDKANKSLQRAMKAVDDNASEEAKEHLEEAKKAFDDAEYFEARRLAVSARSAAQISAFANLEPEEVQDRAMEEQEDMREAARELRETNMEMADELRNAESPGERLEIIRESREERLDIIGKMRKGHMPQEDDGEMEDESVESSSLEAELEDSELEVSAEYTGRTGGFNVERNVSMENGSISVEFNFASPDGPATQAITEYTDEVTRTLSDGSYSLEASLKVDGEVRNEISESMNVPGEAEFEAEAEKEQGGAAAEPERVIPAGPGRAGGP